MSEQVLKQVTDKVIEAVSVAGLIQVEVSAKHVHLTAQHVEQLFGKGATLTPKRELSQPGQYLCEERVTIVGSKGKMERVAVLGPVRPDTQVEISISDSIALGVKAPLRLSGDVAGSAGLTLVGQSGSVEISEGAIVALRHIHMIPQTANSLGICDKEFVNVEVLSERPVIFKDVVVRVSPQFRDRMHVDFDEANGAGVKGFTLGKISKN